MQSSKNLSTTKIASSEFNPITFISVFIFLVLEILEKDWFFAKLLFIFSFNKGFAVDDMTVIVVKII